MAENAPLGLILLDGGYERVHYGLAMAAAALAVNRPAVLFFTNGALLALTGGAGGRRAGAGGQTQGGGRGRPGGTARSLRRAGRPHDRLRNGLAERRPDGE